MAASYAVDVSAQRKPADRRSSDRSRVAGRYDGGRTPLPPGGQLATMPREDNRASLQQRLEAVRKRLHRAPSAQQLAALRDEEQRLLTEKEAAPGKAAEKKLKAVRERLGHALTCEQSTALHDDERRLTAALAAMGESLAAVGIVDPMGDGRSSIKATVNRQTDVLELERSHGRISDAAYRAGRIVQDVLEKVGRIGGSGWDMSRGDRSTIRGNAVARAMEQAQDTRRMLGFIEGRLGMIDARLIRRVLGEGMSYDDCAALQGKAGERGQRYVAGRVRDALEELAEAFASKGRTPPTPDDAYRAAAASMAVRQDGSLAGGATLARLEADLAELEAETIASGGGREREEVEAIRTAIAVLRLRQAEAAARCGP